MKKKNVALRWKNGCWYASYRVPVKVRGSWPRNPRRGKVTVQRNLTTNTTDRKTAQKLANQWRDEEFLAIGNVALRWRNSCWQASYCVPVMDLQHGKVIVRRNRTTNTTNCRTAQKLANRWRDEEFAAIAVDRPLVRGFGAIEKILKKDVCLHWKNGSWYANYRMPILDPNKGKVTVHRNRRTNIADRHAAQELGNRWRNDEFLGLWSTRQPKSEN